MGKSNVKRILRPLIYLVLFGYLLASLFPFYWIIVTALKPEEDIYRYPPVLLPKRLSSASLMELFNKYNFSSYFVNSFIVAAGTTAMALIIGSLAAYSLSRLRFPGDNLFTILLMGALMVPPVVLIIPLYVMLSNINLTDTHLGLIFVNVGCTIPLVVWMMRGFFLTIPKDLEDAARIDGCSYLSALWRIVMPLSAPGLAAAAIFIFLIVWNEFLFALVFSSNIVKTLPVATSEFVGVFEISWGLLSAAAVVTSVPILLFILIFQRRLISGLTQGAIKG